MSLTTIRLAVFNVDTGEPIHDETFPVEGDDLIGFDKGMVITAGPYRGRVVIRVRFDPPLIVAAAPDAGELELE